jgi:hypothetical protein
MSNTTTETQAAPANLRQARKELAQAKAPAKKAPAKKAEKKDGTVYTYEAGPSRAGLINRRSFGHEVVLAADVQDPQHPSKRWQQGVITRMFSTQEMAQRYKERLESEGCNVELLPVKLISKEAGK